MNWFYRIIRYLFLVKEIVSKVGAVHFRRYRLIRTPWFALYIHQILRSDMDSALHDHPFDFSSLILKGSYLEQSMYPSDTNTIYCNEFFPGDVVKHKGEELHKLTLTSKSVWTLVLTSGNYRDWGYHTCRGWVNHRKFRQMKREC